MNGEAWLAEYDKVMEREAEDWCNRDDETPVSDPCRPRAYDRPHADSYGESLKFRHLAAKHQILDTKEE